MKRCTRRKQKWVETLGLSEQEASEISKNIAVFSTLLDVVKNKIMTQPDVKNPPFPSMASCFKHIYKTDGLKGFYRGKNYPLPLLSERDGYLL